MGGCGSSEGDGSAASVEGMGGSVTTGSGTTGGTGSTFGVGDLAVGGTTAGDSLTSAGTAADPVGVGGNGASVAGGTGGESNGSGGHAASGTIGGSDSGGSDGTGTGGAANGGTTGLGGVGGGAAQAGWGASGAGPSGGAGASDGVGGAPAGGGSGGAEQQGGATGGTAQGGAGTVGPLVGDERLISFGTLLNPQAVVASAQQLAQSQVNASAPNWRATGDQHRTYTFDEANTEESYRICVPTDWNGEEQLPLVVFLHGAGSDENTYLDQNSQQMVNLAQQYGYLLVSPKGADGAYGNFLRLSAPFGNEPDAEELMAQVTQESERTNELSEMDVINVLELVLAEYPVDRDSMFLAGHSMGSGGTWYIGGKYPDYWTAMAPMSGPFVQQAGYPWESVHGISILVTEGTQTPSLEGSRLLRDWLLDNGFDAEYKEVDADHGGMIPLVLPDVFDFFERSRAN